MKEDCDSAPPNRFAKFSHTYAVHSCRKCKEHTHTSRGSPNWSLYYVLLAAGLAVPLWIFLMAGPLRLPWYYAFGILAGELLLFFLAGFVSGILLMFRGVQRTVCPKCGMRLQFTGRYFKTNEKLNVEDCVLLTVYIGANIGLWMFILSGGLYG